MFYIRVGMFNGSLYTKHSQPIAWKNREQEDGLIAYVS